MFFFTGVDMETGEVIEGVDRQAEETAYSIHLGVYRQRPDIQSIMHTHARYATTLAVLEVSLVDL